MHQKVLAQNIIYDGTALRPHWIFDQTGLIGDAIVAFVGGANVPITNMVDLVDVHANEHIYSEEMVHFIIEHFRASLPEMVLRQRLFTSMIADYLSMKGVTNVKRSGDDVFVAGKKLSVSIATVSPVSALIHFGVNVSSHNTPLPTSSLNDLGINATEFAASLLQLYVNETDEMYKATCKVRSV